MNHLSEGFVEARIAAGDGDPDRLGAEAVTDLELLARGSFFIGTLGSNLGRAAFEIMAARLGYVPPYASVDGKGWKYGQSAYKEVTPPLKKEK